MNETLMRPFTEEEVLKAVKQMHPTKAPGPDGMTPLFFQKFWSIIRSDVLISILGVLNLGHDPTLLNHTNIILIPKIKHPKSPKDYRPISLCNVVIRIITKTIANRLKSVLPTLISPAQSAFIPGRSIVDNAMVAFETFHSMKQKKVGKEGHMAMKLDMSKAYDRVEWDFLRAVLIKMGLCNSWVNLMMRCVVTVSYSVLLNGEPTLPFKPERGICQGDPLSPYLFLFCAEAFSNLLYKAERDGRIHGFKANRRAPMISHLFFADYTILFVRANMKEADEVKNINKKYEGASGQRINLEKTEITVSSNVSLQRRLELSYRLGVRGVDEHDKYLGLPTIIGRSKRKVFENLVERACRKMKDWKEKSLSKAGKEVLIKSVIQSIPSYVMNCFLLPITTCEDLEKAVARFFWGNATNTRNCHWVNWEKMSKSKNEGGMGFRELHQFNTALLAKQFWNLLHNPDSLVATMLKAKYFHNGNLMSANIGNQPSFLWRCILAARPLVEKGIGWRVGNGCDIKVYKDAWIGVVYPSKATQSSYTRDQEMKVSELIDNEQFSWRREVVRSLFNREEADRILSIPLNRNLPPDRSIWVPEKNGKFSVRTAYHLAVKAFSKIQPFRASSSQIPVEWKKLWQIKVTPAVKNFLWRACLNSLPTKDNLAKRKISDDPTCSLCGEMMESLDHLMLKCRVTARTWCWSPLRIDNSQLKCNTFKELLWNYINIGMPQCTVLFSCLAWSIWKGRNKFIFENIRYEHEEIIRQAHKLEMELANSHGNTTNKLLKRTCLRWTPPEEGSTKLNTDVAIKQNGLIGMGFVLRDHRGKILLAGKSVCLAQGDSTLLEGLATRYGISMVCDKGWQNIVVESDSESLIECINGKKIPDFYCEVIIQDIKSLAHSEGITEFKFTPREGNKAAHIIAHGHAFCSSEQLPNHVRSIAAVDANP